MYYQQKFLKEFLLRKRKGQISFSKDQIKNLLKNPNQKFWGVTTPTPLGKSRPRDFS